MTEHTSFRVLHVTECYGGGVSRAIISRVKATPEIEHHLLWVGDETPVSSGGAAFASVTKLPDGLHRRTQAARALVRDLRPDVVHAHSSWAGVYTRVGKLRVPIVYEPHCFKFDDPTLFSIKRFVFRLAERILARRTTMFGVLSAHEEALAHTLGPNVQAILLPNVPSVPILPKSGQRAFEYVSMVGRLCAQKDPEFFIEVVKELRKIKSGLVPIWIGDGERNYREMLESEGIEVTSWLDGNQVSEKLSSSVYIHSAAYEGFPLSLLDAAACRSPIVARLIPAFEGLPILLGVTPRELADIASSVSMPGSDQCSALDAGSELLASYSEETLSKQLNLIYSHAKAVSVTGRHSESSEWRYGDLGKQ